MIALFFFNTPVCEGGGMGRAPKPLFSLMIYGLPFEKIPLYYGRANGYGNFKSICDLIYKL